MLDHATAQKIIDLMVKSISFSDEDCREEALACLDEALKIHPDFLPVLERRGIVVNKLARYEEAVESFDRVLKFMNLSRVHQLRYGSLLHALAGYEPLSCFRSRSSDKVAGTAWSSR